MLPFQIFKEIVEHTPLVSIDFVVRAPDNSGTQYIVLAYELNLSSEIYSFPCIQHSDYK